MQLTALPPAFDLVRLTRLNQGWRPTMRLAEMEPLRFSSTDDAFIEGWFMRPLDAAEGARHPLIVRLHDGPLHQLTWAFSWERQWLVAQGYAVLLVNPRGSSGYGQVFADRRWSKARVADADDVLAGLDHLQERGAIDPDRIGIAGWGYGGFLTNYLISGSDRFGAAVSGASEADRFAGYGTDEIQRWRTLELGLPYVPTARRVYGRLQPAVVAGEVVTPTMFTLVDGESHLAAAMSEGMFLRLRRRMAAGGPETGLIIYPRSDDPNGEPSLVIDRWRRYKAWFDRHLLGDQAADPFFGADAW